MDETAQNGAERALAHRSRHDCGRSGQPAAQRTARQTAQDECSRNPPLVDSLGADSVHGSVSRGSPLASAMESTAQAQFPAVFLSLAGDSGGADGHLFCISPMAGPVSATHLHGGRLHDPLYCHKRSRGTFSLRSIWQIPPGNHFLSGCDGTGARSRRQGHPWSSRVCPLGRSERAGCRWVARCLPS